MTGQRIAVVGSRGYFNLAAVKSYVQSLAPGTVVVTGGAPGVDWVAEDTARRCGLPVVVIRPEWQKHGKKAGALRNHEIVRQVTQVVAFWDGKSKGTKMTLDMAHNLGIQTEVFLDQPDAVDGRFRV